jgi:hypothetical protein
MRNDYNLPEPLVKAMTPEKSIMKVGRYSVTGLIDSPLRRVLLLQHFDDIDEDVSSRLWALLGQAIHMVIDKHSGEMKSEVKMEVPVKGGVIVGIADLYHNKTITDWKVTSVWSYLLGLKDEWVSQLNAYAWLHRKSGLAVDKLSICAILRDWQHSKSAFGDNNNKDYPPIPFIQIDVPLMSMNKLDEYIESRLALHQEAEKAYCFDDIISIPPCTAKERWERPTQWKVKTKTAKKALRVLETKEAAEKWMAECKSKDTFISEVKGQSVRCVSYCGVAPFCPHLKTFTEIEDDYVPASG